MIIRSTNRMWENGIGIMILLSFLLTAGCGGNDGESGLNDQTRDDVGHREPLVPEPDSGTIEEGDLWVLSSDPGVGAIGRETDEDDLRRLYGAANVTAGEAHAGEGEMEPATVLFADDSLRMLKITWGNTDPKDSVKSLPQRIYLEGNASHWTLLPGISLGLTIDSLEQLNGRPFTLLGFEWDYNGTVVDWNGGRLESLKKNGFYVFVRFFLGPTADQDLTEEEYTSLAGDRELSSDDPVLRKGKPTIGAIIIDMGGK